MVSMMISPHTSFGQSGFESVHAGRWPNRSTKVTSCAGFRGATAQRPVGYPRATMLASIHPSSAGTPSRGKISA